MVTVNDRPIGASSGYTMTGKWVALVWLPYSYHIGNTQH